MLLHGAYKGSESQVKGMAAKFEEGVALKSTKATCDGTVAAQFIHTPKTSDGGHGEDHDPRHVATGAANERAEAGLARGAAANKGPQRAGSILAKRRTCSRS